MTKYTPQRLLEMMNRVGGMPINENIVHPLLRENDGGSTLPPGFSENDLTPLEVDVEQTPCETGIDEDIHDMGVNSKKISPEEIQASGKEKVQAQLAGKTQGIGPEGRFHASTYRQGMDLSNVRDVNGLKIDTTTKGKKKKKYNVELDELPDIDLDKIKDILLTPPTADELLGQNKKMLKSNIYSISLPALKSLVFNVADQSWYVIKVCSKAGECVNWCYAQIGRYVMFDPPIRRRMQILNYLINNWEAWRTGVINRINSLVKSHGDGEETVVRWHDSGDFISTKYMQIAFEIATETPKAIHYAYTKEVSMVKSFTNIPPNFEFKFSYGGKEDSLIKANDPSAVVAPPTFFSHLHPPKPDDVDQKEWEKGGHWKFETAWDEIKAGLVPELSKKYHFNVDKHQILTHDEYMAIPHKRELPQERKYFVIGKPGDTDIPASRKDTMAIVNLEHK